MSSVTMTHPGNEKPKEVDGAYSGAKPRLMQELKEFQKEKWVNVELIDGGLFKWNIGLMVINEESVFNGAYFKAEMTFTDQYPHSPPTFKFLRPPYHPNIYSDGKVCISILHAPGEDEQSGESAAERWCPLHSVETVLRSVLLLLEDPEINSPANVDAGVMYRDHRATYDLKAKETVEESKKDIPEDFTMPTTLNTAPPPKDDADDDFWNESDGGSDSEDFGMGDDDDDEGDQQFDESDGEEEMEDVEGTIEE